jgi:hypothetical protein
MGFCFLFLFFFVMVLGVRMSSIDHDFVGFFFYYYYYCCFRVLCKFFAHGACLKGEHCEFSHDWKDPPNNVNTML